APAEPPRDLRVVLGLGLVEPLGKPETKNVLRARDHRAVVQHASNARHLGMAAFRSTARGALLAAPLAVAGLVFGVYGCSSDSAPSSGGPLGNPECDGGDCSDGSVVLDSSPNDAQFNVDTTIPDTKGGDAPVDATTGAPAAAAAAGGPKRRARAAGTWRGVVGRTSA